MPPFTEGQDPMDEIAAAVLADTAASELWDASDPPSSPCGTSSPLSGWADAVPDGGMVPLPPSAISHVQDLHYYHHHHHPHPYYHDLHMQQQQQQYAGLKRPVEEDVQQQQQRVLQRPKQYKKATPSRFCHVCGRKSGNISVAICGRILDGLCRKVICELCFKKYRWESEAYTEKLLSIDTPDPSWMCPHCKGACVPKAQCNTYRKTNLKRHLALRERRCHKRAAAAEAAHSPNTPSSSGAVNSSTTSSAVEHETENSSACSEELAKDDRRTDPVKNANGVRDNGKTQWNEP